MEDSNRADLVELTADIISAYVSNNTVVASDLPAIIGDVHDALSKASNRIGQTEREELRPAVALKKSVTPDYIVCLEDGKQFKSLKRHLRTVYDLTPDQYRTKWGLAPTYPTVAPNYAAARSELAKRMGLGQQRRRSEPAATEARQAKGSKRGRSKKVA